MIKTPWGDVIEQKLKPYQGVVSIGLIIIVLVVIWALFKGKATGKTALLAWLISP